MTCSDFQYTYLMLELLSSAMIIWTKGRPQYKQLSPVLLYYNAVLHESQPWSQLAAQVSL